MQNDEKKPVPYKMPTFGEILKKTDKQPNQEPDKKEFISQMVEKISQRAEEDLSPQVPSFNLGNQILSQQRKIAGLKRKSPATSNTVPVNTIKPAPIKIVPFEKSEPVPSDFVVQASTKEIVSNKIKNFGDFPPTGVSTSFQRVAPTQSSGAPLQPMSPQQRIIADIIAREILALTALR